MNSSLFPDSQQLSNARIFIVDDEQAHIRVLEWALRHAKFGQLKTLTDSTVAIKEFAEFQPDLVLLDWNMPQVDGSTVLKQIRESLPPDEFLPVVVLTGDNTADTRGRALAAGANDFLPKPLDYTEVMMRIKNLLQTRFLYKQAREIKKQLDVLSAEKAK